MNCWVFNSIPSLQHPQCDNENCLRHCHTLPSEQSHPQLRSTGLDPILMARSRERTVCPVRKLGSSLRSALGALAPGQVISPPSTSVKQGWKMRSPPHEVTENWKG